MMKKHFKNLLIYAPIRKMNRRFLKFFWIFSIFIVFSACERPHGFTLKKICSYHVNDPKWDVSPLSSLEQAKLNRMLLSPFTYLNSGNHCYTFTSADNEYVLKFFKQKHMHTQSFIDYLPMPLKTLLYPTKKHLRRQKEREKSFNSYKIAYEHLKIETGIFYLHLNKTNYLNKSVTLIDHHGNKIPIDIDQMEFLIQKRAQVGYEHLEEILCSGKKEDAFKSIVSLMTIIAHRIEKGFSDKDLQFSKNFGFIENQAIEIDIGELRENSTDRTSQDIQREMRTISLQLTHWIANHYPEYQEEANRAIQKVINQMQGPKKCINLS